jgi:hypothetical protein
MTSPAPRVVSVRHAGQVYTPVMVGQHMLDLVALTALATTTGEHPAVRRRFRFVLIDEMELVDDGGWQYDLSETDEAQTRGVKLPLVFSNSGLPIGVVEGIMPQPSGAIPGTTGRCLTATARLFDSQLSDCAWQALREGIFSGVCSDLDSEETPAQPGDPRGWDLRIRSEFRYVMLGPLATCHYPGARVLERWTEPA